MFQVCLVRPVYLQCVLPHVSCRLSLLLDFSKIYLFEELLVSSFPCSDDIVTDIFYYSLSYICQTIATSQFVAYLIIEISKFLHYLYQEVLNGCFSFFCLE